MEYSHLEIPIVRKAASGAAKLTFSRKIPTRSKIDLKQCFRKKMVPQACSTHPANLLIHR
jgi:hypothetical protein